MQYNNDISTFKSLWMKQQIAWKTVCRTIMNSKCFLFKGCRDRMPLHHIMEADRVPQFLKLSFKEWFMDVEWIRHGEGVTSGDRLLNFCQVHEHLEKKN